MFDHPVRAITCAPAVTAAVLLAAVPAAHSAESGIAVLNTAPLALQAKKGSSSAKGVLTVLNTGKSQVTATVELQAQTDGGVTCGGERDVSAGKATRIQVTCDGLKSSGAKTVKGQLVVSGAGAPVAHALTIAPPKTSPRSSKWAWRLIIGAAALGGALGAGIALWALVNGERRRRLWGPAPGPSWSFSDSWGTTLTAVGALLATVLSGVTYPKKPEHISKDTLTGVSLLFAALVVVAPFVFQALRRPNVSPADPDKPLWGYNSVLLLSCSLTYAAVMGELGALALFCDELLDGGVEGAAALTGLALIAVGATWYFLLTAGWFANTDWKKLADDKAQKVAVAEVGPEDVGKTVVVQAPQAPLRWTLP